MMVNRLDIKEKPRICIRCKDNIRKIGCNPEHEDVYRFAYHFFISNEIGKASAIDFTKKGYAQMK